jgi:hypothetical protein
MPVKIMSYNGTGKKEGKQVFILKQRRRGRFIFAQKGGTIRPV